jgi:cation diffusion facilitator family transporter
MVGHHDHHDEASHDHDHDHDAGHGAGGSHPVAAAAHGHAHDEHEHGAGGHSHGTGVLGWLRGTFAHSHSIEDKIDASMESNALGIWALKWSLVGLGVTAFLQAIIVVMSGSVSLLADTIHNFGDATTSLPLWVAFALAKRGASRRFTYGYGKTEDVAGVIIVLVIFISACIAAYEAIMRFFHPQEVRYLGWVAAAAVIGFLGNEAVAQFRIRVGTQIGSAALVADGQHARVDGFTSLAVLIGVGGILAGFPILDPLVGIAITIAILFIVKDAARAVWRRLIDGIEPEIVTQLERVPLDVDGVRGVHRVRARWVGHKIEADLHLAVDPELTVRESHTIGERVEEALREEIHSLGGVVIHVCPADLARPTTTVQPATARASTPTLALAHAASHEH